jgi:hypothetical protein
MGIFLWNYTSRDYGQGVMPIVRIVRSIHGTFAPVMTAMLTVEAGTATLHLTVRVVIRFIRAAILRV